MTMLLTSIVVSAALLIVYHHLGYPLLLRVLARRARLQPSPAPASSSDSDLPSIRLIVPARNEARVLAQKIANLAAIDYPDDKLLVVIALDGCTDNSRAVVSAALARVKRRDRFTIHEWATNRGKVAVLNDLVSQADTDIVALSDASALISPDALLRAAAHFRDNEVGVVCGTYQLKTPGSEGERAYWEYQVRVKADEAAAGAPMGAHGAFYLIRRKHWQPMPIDTINDDFIIPMRIVAQGYRAIYDRQIVALELEKTETDQNIRRRIRIGAGNMQQLARLRSLLSPRFGMIAFVFASGKALRPMMPFLAVTGGAALVTLAALGNLPAFALAILLTMLCGLAIHAIRNPGSKIPRPLRLFAYLIEGHTASAIGAIQFLTGKHITAWQPFASDHENRWRYLSPTVRISKRLFDLAAASVLLIVLLVLLPFIALAIRLDSPGRVFYRQLRVGRTTPVATEIFQLIKFRTMHENAEARGAQLATKGDPRITRVGRFLRKTRLDELPQCINVLRGEMSIIGPRPERPGFFTTLEDAIPFYTERTYGVRPGITGLAQVHLPYDQTVEDVRMKCVYDHAYATRITSWFNWLKTDLEIVGKTLGVMVAGKGQ